jgi:beta-lysine 5,6-aminomutase beta subunit
MAGESHLVRAYGDRRDDGVIQLSFTLPVPLSDKAKEAARQFCNQLGLLDVKVAAAEPAADGYTFFVVYARADVSLDYASIDVPEIVFKKLGFDQLNKLIEDRVARRVVVLGACTGSDTHTVGIDAILNMKGFAGDYGLERYPWFEAYNLGSQVPNEELIRRAEEHRADAILVSQVVTQRDVHKDNSRQFIDVAKAHGLKGKTILLLGGPRVDHKLAMELGFDAGFGPGTKPSDVANYIVHALLKKMGKEPEDMHYEGEPE